MRSALMSVRKDNLCCVVVVKQDRWVQGKSPALHALCNRALLLYIDLTSPRVFLLFCFPQEGVVSLDSSAVATRTRSLAKARRAPLSPLRLQMRLMCRKKAIMKQRTEIMSGDNLGLLHSLADTAYWMKIDMILESLACSSFDVHLR